MKKIVLDIIIGITFLLFVCYVGSKLQIISTINKERDSVIAEYNRLDTSSYRDFELFAYLIDTLMNYHKYPIRKDQLFDFFTIDTICFAYASDSSTLTINGLNVSFHLYNNVFCREELPFYYNDTINLNYFSSRELCYYLQTKRPFHREVHRDLSPLAR